MKEIKYFIESSVIIILFIIMKIFGLKISRLLSSFIFRNIGPLFRSKKISHQNLSYALPNINETKKMKFLKKCGLTMEKFFQNTCLLKILGMILNFQKKLL